MSGTFILYIAYILYYIKKCNKEKAGALYFMSILNHSVFAYIY